LIVEEDLHHQISDKAVQEMQKFFTSEMSPEVKNRSIVNRIVTSIESQRVYRYIQLKNEMRVMVIHDPDCANEVSVSMQIMVGSLNDPDGFAGLARLCAMVLQHGSVEFPAEDHYEWLVGGHNG
jgi:secreted Zn-dependent insulinase-like peptidase